VIIRKCVLALSVAAFLAGSVGKSNALPADPIVAGGTAFGGVGWVAAGIIGVAGVLCAYDLVLKFQGVKNWDGSAKTLKRAKR
jgi:hypothetical protein